MHTRAQNHKNCDFERQKQQRKIKMIFQKRFFRSRAAWIVLYSNSQALTFSQTDSRNKSKIRFFVLPKTENILKNVDFFIDIG